MSESTSTIVSVFVLGMVLAFLFFVFFRKIILFLKRREGDDRALRYHDLPFNIIPEN